MKTLYPRTYNSEDDIFFDVITMVKVNVTPRNQRSLSVWESYTNQKTDGAVLGYPPGGRRVCAWNGGGAEHMIVVNGRKMEGYNDKKRRTVCVLCVSEG